MNESLDRWIGEADALIHQSEFKVPQALMDYGHITGRAGDYYLGLVGELFAALTDPTAQITNWPRLANALAQFSSDALRESANNNGISTIEAALFSSAAYYCGGFPASASIVLRQFAQTEFNGDTAIACYDMLARPAVLVSDVSNRLRLALRRGDMGTLEEIRLASSIASQQSLQRGPDQWIPSRLLEKLLERFLSSNLRSVLPDGENQFWTRLIESLTDREPPTWEFFPSQQDAIRRGLLTSRESFALQMPTGAGKTTLCETLLYAETMRNQQSVGVLLVPFRSLAAELRGTLVAHLNDMGIQARCAYGGTVPSGAEVAELDATRVMVATPESLSGILSADPEFYKRISLVICDEGHLLESPGRGIGLELLLARMKARPSGPPRFIFISAIVPNVEEINSWLGGNSGGVVRSEYRPAIAEFSALVSAGTDSSLDLIMHPHQPAPTRYTVVGFLRKLDFRWTSPTSGRSRTYPFSSHKTRAVAAARKALVMGAVAVFATNKRGNQGCLGLAEELLNQLECRLTIPEPKEFMKAGPVGLVAAYLDKEYGIDWIVTKALRAGAIVHHGDIPQETRELLESLIRRGDIHMAFCTNTLAEGVNLPIRTLVLYSVARVNADGQRSFLSARDIKNLVGRAGRPGSNTRGLVICANFDQWPQIAHVANLLPGDDIKGALRSLMTRLRDSLAVSRATLTNSGLERTLVLLPLIDGIDMTLLDLMTEEVGQERLTNMAVELADETFASQQATNESKELMRTVFKLRAERIGQVHATGHLAWIRSTGTRIRILDLVERDLLGRRPRWDDVSAILDVQLIETFLDWAWPLPEMQSAVRDGFRIGPGADLAPARGKLSYIVWNWLSGARFAEMAASAALSIDDLLSVHATVIAFTLQTLVEQGIAILGKFVESRGEVLSPAVVEFPMHLRFGVSTPAGRQLAAHGVRHRSAFVSLGQYAHDNSIAFTPFESFKEYLRASLTIHEREWRARLGDLVYQNTATDLL